MVTTFLKVKNRVYSNLVTAIDDDDVSVVITLGEHGRFPDTYPFDITIEDEIMRCTNRVANTLTVTRAQQDTTAAAHPVGVQVALNITAKSVSDLNAAVNTIEQAMDEGFEKIIIKGTADYPLDMQGATVNSGGADIRLSNEAKIDNTVAGTLKLMTTTSGYVSISEGQTIIKGDYLDLDLDVALRFIGAGKYVDGALIFRDNITLGRDAANITVSVYGKLVIQEDDQPIEIGAGAPVKILWETADANANMLAIALPDGGAVNSPTIMIGDQSVLNFDLGTIIDLSALDEPNIIIVDADADSFLAFGYHSDDTPHIHTNQTFRLEVSGDTDDYFKFKTDTGVPTIFATGSYLRIGDVQFTQHSLNAEDDLMVSGKFEVSGVAFLDSTTTITMESETAATNALWVSLKSTATSGDLTGIRSRVYGNASSAGANVRGAYLEAKMGGNSKFAAMLEGALIHADYSAGSATISGDVRGLTVHISQGAGLNAANLYGILLSIQTRGSESITTDDVGLLIRNEAVGGNGRVMDAAIRIADLNMGGGRNGFYIGLDFTGITCTTAEIDLDFGKIIFDQDGDTDIHCDTDDELDFKLSGSNFIVMASGVLRPATTNQVDLGSSSKQFKDIYVDGIGYIDTMAAFTFSDAAYYRSVDNDTLIFVGGTHINYGAVIALYGKDSAINSGFYIKTPNAANNASLDRISITGDIDTAVMSLWNMTVTGLSLSGTLTLNAQVFDAGSGNLAVSTTSFNAGVKVTSTQETTGGAAFIAYTNSASPANGDNVGGFMMKGEDSNSAEVEYGTLWIQIEDVTAGAHAGKLQLILFLNGGVNTAMTVSAAGEVAGDLAYAEFDKWNDKAVVQQIGVRRELRRLDIAEKFVDMGIATRKDTGGGYMLNLQQGFWFNFHALKVAYAELDNMAVSIADLEQTVEARFESVDEKIERLEGELAELKASLN